MKSYLISFDLRNDMFLQIFVVGFTVLCGTEGAWQLIWSDEFNGNKLNDNDWNYETGGGGNVLAINS